MFTRTGGIGLCPDLTLPLLLDTEVHVSACGQTNEEPYMPLNMYFHTEAKSQAGNPPPRRKYHLFASAVF